MSNDTPHQGIVAGFDGSPSGMMAVRWAAREAVMRRVALSLVHVINEPPSGLLSLGGGVLPARVDAEQWRKTQGASVISAGIEIAKASVREGEDLDLRSEVYCAATVPALVDLSKEAQMMVVGSRGQGLLGRVLLGSVSSGLIHHAHCPVAVIHAHSSVDPLEPSYRPVLVGIDGSPVSELATSIAFDEACRRGVDLVALHAWSDGDLRGMPGLEWPTRGSGPAEVLAERLAGWRERYPDVRVEPRLVFDRPARRLLDEASSSQLVVLGSHGRGGFSGALLGSVSTAVAQATDVPMIIARES